MSKLTALQINIIMAVVALLLSVILFFALIKPKNEETEKVKVDTAGLQQQGGTPEAESGKQKELEKARKVAAQTKKDWEVNERRIMPDLKFDPKADVLTVYSNNAYLGPDGRSYGLKDLPTVWGRWLNRWYDAQKDMGIDATRVGTEFPIPAFSTDPNAVSNLTSLTFPESGKPWQVTMVCKTFGDAMKHLKQFNNMGKHGMPVVNNVALAGQSPALFMTYDLIIYIIPAKAPPTQDPVISGGGGGSSAPGAGGFGGMMGGGRMPGSGGMGMGSGGGGMGSGGGKGMGSGGGSSNL